MKYMGSKRRIAKYILPIMLANRTDGQYFVEPFCGGCNLIDKVNNPRLANDNNEYLIALLQHLQTEQPFDPEHADEVLYKHVRQYKDKYPMWFVGYVGFSLSFSGKFFAGYRRDNEGKRNYVDEAIRELRKQQPNLVGIEFVCGSYDELTIPPNSIIYCDPPYKGTTKYRDKFDYDKFYEWCRTMKALGHTVYVSEYSMPDDFTCVWSKELHSNLHTQATGKIGVEKLFTLQGD